LSTSFTVAINLSVVDILNGIYKTSEYLTDILIFSLFPVDRYTYIQGYWK